MQHPPVALPPLQTLRAFVAVARTKSFTAAADALSVTQTAVSHQIAQLEDWIGGRLFVRDRRGAEITAVGAALLPDVVRALGDLQQALDRARLDVGNPKLRVSTTPEFSEQWLAPRLIDFCDRYPDLDVSVIVQYRRARLVDGDIDVAIWLSGTAENGSEQLTADEEFAVCAPENSAACRNATPCELRRFCATTAPAIPCSTGAAGTPSFTATPVKRRARSISTAALATGPSRKCWKPAVITSALRWCAVRWWPTILLQAGWCAALPKVSSPTCNTGW